MGVLVGLQLLFLPRSGPSVSGLFLRAVVGDSSLKSMKLLVANAVVDRSGQEGLQLHSEGRGGADHTS